MGWGAHSSLAPPHCEEHVVGAKRGAAVGGSESQAVGEGLRLHPKHWRRPPEWCLWEESDVHVEDDAGCSMQSRQQRARGSEQRPSWGVNQQAHGQPRTRALSCSRCFHRHKAHARCGHSPRRHAGGHIGPGDTCLSFPCCSKQKVSEFQHQFLTVA